MIKRSKIRRPAAPRPAPSRIRREPAPVEKPASARRINWDSRELEIGLALAGILFFALAINAVVFDFGELLSH